MPEAGALHQVDDRLPLGDLGVDAVVGKGQGEEGVGPAGGAVEGRGIFQVAPEDLRSQPAQGASGLGVGGAGEGADLVALAEQGAGS